MANFGTPPEDGVGLWLVGLFAASIGLPFVALSASAPLLQSWFAASGHPQARNPYVLYAASNLGSFAALLAYPLAIESLLPLRAQAWVWSVGFAGLAVLVAIAGMIAARGAGSPGSGARNRRQADAARSSRPGSRLRRSRPAWSLRSPPISRPTSPPRRCSGCCRSRSIC